MALHRRPFEPVVDVVVAAPAAEAEAIAAAPALRALAERLQPAVYVDVGDACNLGCTYCGLPRDGTTVAAGDVLRRTIDAAAALGWRKVALIGGEPTIRRDLPALVRHARAAGMRDVLLTTNGLALALPDVRAGLLDAGVTAVHLSLDTLDAKTADALGRRADVLQLVLPALEALLREHRIEVFVYAVLSRPVLALLAADLRRLAALGARAGRTPTWVWTALKPQGRALEHADALLAPLDDVAAAVRAALPTAAQLGVEVALRGLPACLVPGYEARRLDALLTEARLDLRDGAVLPQPRDAHAAFGADCERCADRPRCAGVHRAYLAAAAPPQLRPLCLPRV